MTTLNLIRPAAEWRDPRHRRGLAGELVAGRFLLLQGWTIVSHRFRWGHHDIDLVAKRANLIAFVEVKAWAKRGFGLGREAVGWRKRRAIEVGALIWRTRYGRADWLYRFDVIEVDWSQPGFPQIVHTEDAWRVG